MTMLCKYDKIAYALLKTLCISILCSIAIGPVDADIVAYSSLPELVEGSDVVCIGKVLRITANSVDNSASGSIVDLQVTTVLKGAIPNSVTFIALRNKSVLELSSQNFASASANNDNVIVFLKQNSSTNELTLTSPGSYPGPVITLGNTKSVPSQQTTSLRRVLSYLVQDIAYSSPATKLEELRRIRDVGNLLDVPHNTSGINYWLSVSKNIKTTIGENIQPSLEEYVAENILPAVISTTNDPDKSVQILSVITAATLQDTAVIPSLVKLSSDSDVNTSSMAIQALRNYRVQGAVRPLVKLLNGDDHSVREAAADALREISDEQSLPFLFDQLNDPDANVRQIVVSALFVITNVRAPATLGPSDQSYVDFWRAWQVKHKTLIKSLRSDFEKAVPSPPLPAFR